MAEDRATERDPREIACHMQFWETEGERIPDRQDALLSLAMALDLLSSALPIALKHVGSEPLKDQLRFWWNFIDMERETDMDGNGGLSDVDIESISMKISDWASIAREIVHSEWAATGQR